MKTFKILLLFAAMVLAFNTNAQVAITTDGSSAESSAMLEVESTDKGLLPPRMTLAQRDAIPSPAEGLMIYNLDTHKPNYFNGNMWMTYDGVSAEPQVGLEYEGGTIFYIFEHGDDGYVNGEIHGLIYANNFTLPAGVYPTWNTGNDIVTGADRSWIGSGLANSLDIKDAQGAGDYAASICLDAVHNGFEDWYLPSKLELLEFYNFTGVTTPYWSSTEIDNSNAWALVSGSLNSYDKDGDGGSWYLQVVPVRSF